MPKDGQLHIDGLQLKRLRRERGLSQEALADACERQHLRVSIATIKRAETAKAVTYRTLKNLADYFAVPVSELSLDEHLEEGKRPESSMNQSRMFILSVIKVMGPIQENQLAQQLRASGALFVETHGSYLVAAFSQYVRLNNDRKVEGQPRILYILYRLLCELKAESSILSPSFSFISLAPLQHDGQRYRLRNCVFTRLIEQARLFPPNQIIVSDQLKALYELQFNFSPILTDAQLFWTLEGEADRWEMPRIPICGRSQELTKLHSQMSVSLNEKRLTVTCIAGDPGMGKTRILQEVRQHSLKAGCVPVWLDAEKNETDWEGLIRHKLNQPNAKIVENGLLSECIKSADICVALLIDNMHLCHEDTMERLSELLCDLSSSPVMVVIASNYKNSDCVIRMLNPEMFISLMPLNDDACKALGAHFKELPAAELRQCIERSNGIPFYLNLLLDTSSDPSVRIPESIQFVIQERLSVLTATEHKAIQFLALAAAPLTVDQLFSLLDDSPDLKALVSSHLVTLNDNNQLEITHELVAEVIVESLTLPYKTCLHTQLANQIEVSHPSPDMHCSEWLYRQYGAAGNAFRESLYLSRYANFLIAEGRYERAEKHLHNALVLVDTAIKGGATGEYSLEQCLDLKLDQMFYLANAYKARHGWYSLAVSDVYEDILKLCDATKSVHRKVNGLFGVWTIALTRLDIPQALEYAQQAYALSEQLENAGCKMQALTALSNTCFWAGQIDDANQYARQALMLFDPEQLELALEVEGQDPRMLAWCFQILTAAQLLDPKAESYLEEMVSTSREVNHPFSMAIALQAGAWLYWTQRNPKKTLAYAQELDQLATECAFPFYQGVSALFRGWALYQISGDAGHLETVVIGYQRWLSSAGFKLTHSLYSAIVGDVLIDDGQARLACDILSEAIQEAEKQGTGCYLPELYCLMSTAGDIQRDWHHEARVHSACTPLHSARMEAQVLPRS